MTRYALYFSPSSSSRWWQQGCRWLGRDARSGEAVAQPVLQDINTADVSRLTQNAKRYGFHATLKAPFRLRPGCTQRDLQTALQSFCATQSPVAVPSPEPRWLDHFLALQPSNGQADIAALAQRCVSHFDDFRAAPDEAELARRLCKPLDARQRELLERWGYPYTEEQYRFHMTLSAPIADAGEKACWQAAAQAWFAIDEALLIDGIALFAEAQPGVPFVCVADFPFGQRQPDE